MRKHKKSCSICNGMGPSTHHCARHNARMREHAVKLNKEGVWGFAMRKLRIRRDIDFKTWARVIKEGRRLYNGFQFFSHGNSVSNCSIVD